MDEGVYEDPTPNTMKDLKRRLRQAQKENPALYTLNDLSYSMPQRLQNVIKKQTSACRILNLPIHALNKRKTILKNFRVKMYSSFDQT